MIKFQKKTGFELKTYEIINKCLCNYNSDLDHITRSIVEEPNKNEYVLEL